MQNIIKATLIALTISAHLPINAAATNSYEWLVKNHPNAFGPTITHHDIEFRSKPNVVIVKEALETGFGYRVLSIGREPDVVGCFVAIVTTRQNNTPIKIAINCLAINVKGFK